MPRKIAVSVENNFIKGLITESTGLKFPENACTETYNCVFDHRGNVTRRLGMEFEEEHTAVLMTLDNNAISTYVWKNVAEEGDLTFVAVQNGNTLHFFQPSADTALSASKHADTVDLSTYLPAGGSSIGAATYECQYASANGKLIVTHPKLETILVEYATATDDITSSAITLRTRDFEGDLSDTLYDPPDIASRPTSTLAALNASHRYNLENQGWTTTTLTSWDTARTDMPSNADVPQFFKIGTATHTPGSAFDFSLVANAAIGNSKAPNGHFIYNLYDTNRATNVSGATESEIALDRVSTCAFYSGRVWYAGLNVQDYNSKLFFSQVIEHEDQLGRCYQVNDPVSETASDLLPADGGVIDLLEAGKILKLIPILNTLFIFCTNGVWSISGSQGTGFAANDYSATKLSNIASVSSNSFVVAMDTVYWWSHTGIYTIRKDQQTNNLSVVNITDDTIKEFFEEIPLRCRELARGAYDPVNKKIQWIFSSTNPQSFTEGYNFNRILNMSLLTGAFYPWSISTSSVVIRGLITINGSGGAQAVNDVTSAAGANNPQAASGTNEIVVIQSSNTSIDEVVKFLVSYVATGNRITFAEEYDTDYLDWTTQAVTGISYDSYFITGYAVRGEGLRKFQENYVNVFSNNEANNSFTIRGLWGYSNSDSSGRWSDSQTFSNVAGFFDYKPRRIKIRGHGLACQLKFANNSTNPFHIVGWTVWNSGNAGI